MQASDNGTDPSRGGVRDPRESAVLYGNAVFAPATPGRRGGVGGSTGAGGGGGVCDPAAKERRMEHSALVKLRHATRSRAGHQRLLDACRRLDRGGTGLVGAKELGAVLQLAGTKGNGLETNISAAEVERLLTWGGARAHDSGGGGGGGGGALPPGGRAVQYEDFLESASATLPI